jgi:hypothetical protein
MAEGSAALARRAAAATAGQLEPKADERFAPAQLSAISRVYARKSALRIATEGLGWINAVPGAAEGVSLEGAVRLPQILGAQSGMIDDMNAVADAVYGRA